MQTFFQHPDTGETCAATYDGRSKQIVITCEGDELLRKSAPTVGDATRELLKFGVDAGEARFE